MDWIEQILDNFSSVISQSDPAGWSGGFNYYGFWLLCCITPVFFS